MALSDIGGLHSLYGPLFDLVNLAMGNPAAEQLAFQPLDKLKLLFHIGLLDFIFGLLLFLPLL